MPIRYSRTKVGRISLSSVLVVLMVANPVAWLILR